MLCFSCQKVLLIFGDFFHLTCVAFVRWYDNIRKILGAQNCGDLQKSQIATFFYQILTKICEVLQN